MLKHFRCKRERERAPRNVSWRSERIGRGQFVEVEVLSLQIKKALKVPSEKRWLFGFSEMRPSLFKTLSAKGGMGPPR